MSEIGTFWRFLALIDKQPAPIWPFSALVNTFVNNKKLYLDSLWAIKCSFVLNDSGGSSKTKDFGGG
jgi:hypothetical protein